ncbi:MAG: ATP-binding protein, partial [Verrucomicrobiae bacterium]|nr:ATP-binding protein [Verrucomicrobiae bacterium]
VFVVAGTVGILFLVQATYRQRSSAEFMALALANAEFVRDAHIPPTERFAGYLSRVLGVEVHFRRVVAPDRRFEAVTVPVRTGVEMTLIRRRPSLLLRPLTAVALAAFWGLSLALAWAIVVPYLKAQRLAMLGQMATSLAHEIQNPVAAIRLHAQLAGNKTILGEATAIENLVNQWMFLAKPQPPQRQAVALDSVLGDAIAALTPMAEHAKVRILFESGGATVEADGRRLAQAFRNLIVNAIQAMPSGGTLTVRAKGRCVVFSDTGPGFSRTALAKCPAMFYSEREGGMGIGLAVANEIVKAHGGTLKIGNRPEGGAQVTIEL